MSRFYNKIDSWESAHRKHFHKQIPSEHITNSQARSTLQNLEIDGTELTNGGFRGSCTPGNEYIEKFYKSKDQLKRSTNSLLNKITIENFPTVAERLCVILEQITTEEELRLVISLTLNKAIDEPNFAEMYADLCLIMGYRTPVLTEISTPIKVPSNRCYSEALFFSLLLQTWTEEFKKLQSSYEAIESKAYNTEDIVLQDKIKMRIKGICLSFAEFVIRRMVGLRGFNMLVSTILGPPKPKEYLLEGVCWILLIAGSFLDNLPAGKSILENCFGRLHELLSSGLFPGRIGYLIQEVFDTRKVNWHRKMHTVKAKELTQLEQEIDEAEYIGGINTRLQYGTVIKLGQRTNILNNPQYAAYVESQEKSHKIRHQLVSTAT